MFTFLLSYRDVVYECSESLSVHKLVTFLYSLATTFSFNKIPAKTSLFSGFNKVGMVSAGSLANASLVGANTVKSPSPLSVSAKPAALTAANKVDRAGVSAAVAAMDFNGAGVGAALVSAASF